MAAGIGTLPPPPTYFENGTMTLDDDDDGCIRFMLFHFSVTGIKIVARALAVWKTCNDAPLNSAFTICHYRRGRGQRTRATRICRPRLRSAVRGGDRVPLRLPSLVEGSSCR